MMMKIHQKLVLVGSAAACASFFSGCKGGDGKPHARALDSGQVVLHDGFSMIVSKVSEYQRKGLKAARSLSEKNTIIDTNCSHTFQSVGS